LGTTGQPDAFRLAFFGVFHHPHQLFRRFSSGKPMDVVARWAWKAYHDDIQSEAERRAAGKRF
jgi:hypothetical protein